jgi:hypothetical protein
MDEVRPKSPTNYSSKTADCQRRFTQIGRNIKNATSKTKSLFGLPEL